MSASAAPQIKNRLLAALPADAYQRLAPHLVQVHLKPGQVLYEEDGPVSHVYFPEDCIASLVSSQEEGTLVELAMVGKEGMAGVSVVLETDKPFSQAVAQTGGRALRMAAGALREELKQSAVLRAVLLRYTNMLMRQMGRITVCSATHTIVERFSCWLLMVQDRMETDDLQFTHEYVAQLLSARRSSVTVAAQQLQGEGLLHYSRGRVRVLDREGLESRACGCYELVREDYDSLLV